MLSYKEWKGEFARELTRAPTKEPRVDIVPPLSDEDVETFSKEIDKYPLPSRHHGGGS